MNQEGSVRRGIYGRDARKERQGEYKGRGERGRMEGEEGINCQDKRKWR
jgi:hypothetical protein